MIIETSKNEETGKYEVDIKTNGVVAELEANKEVSIDVSTYTDPVEIVPTTGKDGMKKATVTLSNILSGGVTVEPLSVTANGTYTAPTGKAYSPVTVNVPSSGGSATAYGWNVVSTGSPSLYYLSVDIAPADMTKARNMKRFSVMSENQITVSSLPPLDTYTRISDTEFEFYMEGGSVVTYTRAPTEDFTLWG